MRNILIVSDEADELYSLFKSVRCVLKKQDSQSKSSSRESNSFNLGRYDIAFLDLDTDGWQQRLFELRQHVPVIAFSKPDIKVAVEAMKIGASDFLKKPLSSSILNDVNFKNVYSYYTDYYSEKN